MFARVTDPARAYDRTIFIDPVLGPHETLAAFIVLADMLHNYFLFFLSINIRITKSNVAIWR